MFDSIRNRFRLLAEEFVIPAWDEAQAKQAERERAVEWERRKIAQDREMRRDMERGVISTGVMPRTAWPGLASQMANTQQQGYQLITSMMGSGAGGIGSTANQIFQIPGGSGAGGGVLTAWYDPGRDLMITTSTDTYGAGVLLSSSEEALFTGWKPP